MRCPHCGSQKLVWDYIKGDVVCSSCGVVIDRIYVNEYTPRGSENAEVTYVIQRSKAPKLKSYTQKYLELLSRIKNKKGLQIDNDAFREYMAGKRPLIKVIRRKKLSKPSGEVAKILKVMNRYPVLKSRTDRARMAIALITISMIRGDREYISRVSSKTGLSKVHIRRLVKLLNNHRNFILESKRVLNTIN